ncbi:PAS domain-containing protein [Desulfofundulus thermobenzoicus]|uniref:PAS domain-containing protein n=1 Tax=Desulfofundulus thermobenzoicus TaxID=29376 RepID=A0A6N7IW62_9FIRM|nr:PAS domain-containing protein [Desulfofundulus thermobenzoicus]MQL53833.1 PAS domain-containing protein [Desulfofundulus thermobenzoicus]
MVNARGCITALNRAAELILGGAATALTGRPIQEVAPGSGLPEVLETGQLQTSRRVVINGKHLVSNLSPVTHDGRVVGAVAVRPVPWL